LLQALACVLIWGLLFWTLSVPAATADTGLSWTVTWDTDWETGTARMVLVQTGNQVTGRYDFREGVVIGTVSGNILSGTWTEYDDSGTFEFILAGDGQSFSGIWNDENVWSGTRTTYFGIPAMTPVWTDYLGTFRIDGIDAQPGDEIAFFDPQGVLCGQYTVVQAGQYGIVRVYGDDPKTTDVDEGATTGDLLTVKIWDSRRLLEITGPDLALKPGLPPSGSSFLPAASPPIWQDQQGYALDVDTSAHFGSPVATPYVSNYLGALTIGGDPAQAGDEVAVFNANGVLCGHTRISTPGQYGILQIYGDDPATAGIVEGPTEGGLLTFKVWSRKKGQEYAGAQLILTPGAALGSFLPSAGPPDWQAAPGSVLDIATRNVDLPPPVALDSLAETVQDQPVSGILLRENPGGGPLTFLLGPSLWYFYVQDALFPSAPGGLNMHSAILANAAIPAPGDPDPDRSGNRGLPLHPEPGDLGRRLLCLPDQKR
jgi:hypothetical protein